MKPGQIVALCWALVFLGLAIWREIVWHRRFRSWRQVDGIVDDFLAFDSASLPVVRFEIDGMKRTLVSSFCLWNPHLGESVLVLFDEVSGRSVMLTGRHRWLVTGLCGSCFFATATLAALSH